MDTWIIWNLTGEHVTDVTNASRTLLMNLRTLDWDDGDLGPAGHPARDAAAHPLLLRSVRRRRTARLGGVPVAGDLGDQQAALFGQTCFSPGEAKNTYGTGCFMLMNTGETPVPSKSGLLTTLGYKIGEQPAVYALEGSIAITGALVQWLRDNLGMIEKSADVESLARTVDDNGGIYFVPAFSGLFAPYWRSDARGAIVGMTRYVNKGHIARAALEATAYQTREVLDAMETDSGVQPDRPQSGWRHGLQRTADAVPGRYSECAGHPPQSGRDDRPGRGLCRRAGRRLLEGFRRTAPTGARTTNGTRTWTPRSAIAFTRIGRKPSLAPSIGSLHEPTGNHHPPQRQP